MVEDLHIPRPVKKDKAKWGDAEITVQNVARLDEAAGVWACVRQVHVARERAAGAQRACWTFVRWMPDHHDAG